MSFLVHVPSPKKLIKLTQCKEQQHFNEINTPKCKGNASQQE